MTLSLRRKILLGFALSLGVLAIVDVAAYASIHELRAVHHSVGVSATVRRDLLELLGGLKDAETGQRGFLLTGEEPYLLPYVEARSRLAHVQRDLDRDFPPGSAERPQLERIGRLVQEKLDELQETVELRRTQGLDAALAVVRTDRGHRMMEALRREVGALLAARDTHLQTQLGAAEAGGERTVLVILLSSALGLAFVGGASVVISREIDVRRRTERELARLSIVARGTEDLVLIARADGVIEWANEAYLRLSRRRLEDVVGRTQTELFLSSGNDAIAARVRDALAAGRPLRETIPVRTLEGAVRHLTITLTPTSAGDGERRFITICHDVSAKIEREQALRALWSAVPDLLVRLDAAGTVLDVKPSPEVSLPALGADARGRTLAELLPAEPAAKLRQAIARALAGETLAPLELTLPGDGRQVEVEARLVTVRGEALLVVRDITARREVERLKNEFVSTVSHELRTPLTAIRGGLGLLEGGVAGELAAEAHELVRIARSNCDRLVRLINDILDLEKIEAGKLELHPAPLDAQALVAKALEGMQGYALQADVRLECEGGQGLRVRGDEDRLLQVLTNLLSNAVKFSPPDGVVSVRLDTPAPGRLRLRVIDRGPGIDAAQQARLFARFEQLDQSDTRRKGGSGLGLAISKAIVERHGGRIGVESAPGEGAAFWVELPLLEQPAPALLPPGSALDVLVVEDHPQLGLALVRRLAAEGFQVALAQSLAEARTRLAQGVPRVLLLDVGLPDGNGLTLVAPGGPAAEVPVVVLTSADRAEEPTPPHLLAAWLTKPQQTDALVEALRPWLPAGGEPRVLVVDDDEAIRHVVSARLRNVGLRTLEAADGEEALARLESEPVDLVVLDVVMPRVDAFALVARLRRQDGARVPLLVYSARELSPEERHLLRLGQTEFLTKARATDAQFVQAVQRLLAGRAAPRSTG